MKRSVVATLAIAAAAAAAFGFWQLRSGDGLPSGVESALELRNLPPNRWVRYHEEKPRDWSRQGHAGIAFDRRRGTLLVFGSDTHGENWDNAVHEFHPLHRRWETHQAAAPPETYRVDADGTPIAGTGVVQPWAMHTYDGIEYHPALDALVVTSTTAHTPVGPMSATIRRQPTWVYELATRRWRALEAAAAAAPNFFAASSAFDERRGLLVAYRQGIWELDPSSWAWRKADRESPLKMHHTMVYDTRRGEIFFFGDYQPSNRVWRYAPGPDAGAQGAWTAHQPQGDPCPPYSSVPVAYDAAEDVFVLVVDDAAPGSAAGAKATSASTFLYDPAADTYTRLPDAGLPAVGMNFMMAWDRNHGVAFLVTGDWRGTVTVWALRPRKR